MTTNDVDQIPEPIQVTLKATKVLEQLNIPYFIGGSMASAVHGVARSTMDVDIIADIQLSIVDQMVDLLKDEFYVDAAMIEDAIRHKTSFNMIHLTTMFKVDIFILKQRAFDQNQMSRRVTEAISEETDEMAFISSIEDIILAKLEWYKNGSELSDRQWRDILGMLSLRKTEINLEYLQKWAAVLHVESLLKRALSDINQ